jgi:hypothetical protein
MEDGMTVTEQPELFRTQGGGRLHIRPCPHIHGVDVIAATAADAAERPVCNWCAGELAGEGRTYHASVEEALADIGAPQHATPELARLLKLVGFHDVFVPFSRSYVAVASGGKSIAWAGKTYVDYRDRPLVTLPDYAPGGGGGVERSQRHGQTCPDCFTLRSLTGDCACDAE